MTQTGADLDELLKLRLVVARFGEMDGAKWWNTRGQLGRLGSMAVRRGFPRTHRFAQARSVFAVAAHRCLEVFPLTSGVSLWNLPESLEEEFDARWEHWLDNASEWTAFFERIEVLSDEDLPRTLHFLALASDQDLEAYSKLRRTAENRTVLLPGVYTGSPADLKLLALGFGRGEPSALAVPHMRREGT